MALNSDDRKWFYDEAQKLGIDTGSEEDFAESMRNDEDRKWYYEQFKDAGYDVGDENEFSEMVLADDAEPEATEGTYTAPSSSATNQLDEAALGNITQNEMKAGAELGNIVGSAVKDAPKPNVAAPLQQQAAEASRQSKQQTRQTPNIPTPGKKKQAHFSGSVPTQKEMNAMAQLGGNVVGDAIRSKKAPSQPSPIAPQNKYIKPMFGTQEEQTAQHVQDVKTLRGSIKETTNGTPYLNVTDNNAWEVTAAEEREKQRRSGETTQFYQEQGLGMVLDEEFRKAESKADKVLADATPYAETSFAVTDAARRETDPAKIIGGALARIQTDKKDEIGNFAMQRLNMNGASGSNDSSEPELSDEEKRYLMNHYSYEYSQICNDIYESLIRDYKNRYGNVATAVIDQAVSNSLIGMVADAVAGKINQDSGLRKQIRQQILDDAGAGAKIASSAIGLALDAPAFMISGGASSFVSKGVQSAVKFGLEQSAKAGGKVLAREVAEKAAMRYIASNPLLNAATNAIASGTNFGTFNSIKEVGRQAVEGNLDLGGIAKEFGSGFVLGGITGAMNGYISAATQGMSAGKKVLADVGGLAGEVAVFSGAELIEKAKAQGISIGDLSIDDYTDALVQNGGLILGMRVNHWLTDPAGAYEGMRNRYSISKGIDLNLTDYDKETLRNAGFNPDRLFGVNGLGKILSTTTKDSPEEIPAGALTIGESPYEEVGKNPVLDLDYYQELMTSSEIPQHAKQWLAYMVEGKVYAPDMVFGARREGNRVFTTNLGGDVIDSKDFKTEEEAMEYETEANAVGRFNSASSIERVAYDPRTTMQSSVLDRVREKTEEVRRDMVNGKPDYEMQQLLEYIKSDINSNGQINIERYKNAVRGNKRLEEFVNSIEELALDKAKANGDRITWNARADVLVRTGIDVNDAMLKSGKELTAQEADAIEEYITRVRDGLQSNTYRLKIESTAKEGNVQGEQIMTDADATYDFADDLDTATNNLMALDPNGNIKKQIDEWIESGETEMSNGLLSVYNALDNSQKQTFDAYVAAASKLKGMRDGIDEQAQEEGDKLKEFFAPFAVDGVVHPATLGDTVVYVTGYDEATDTTYYRTPMDNEVHEYHGKLETMTPIVVDEEAQKAAEAKAQQLSAEVEKNLNYDSRVKSEFVPGTNTENGTVIDTPSGKFMCVGVTENGNYIFKKAQIDANTRLYKAEGEDYELSAEDAMDMQNEYYRPTTTEEEATVAEEGQQAETPATTEATETTEQPTVAEQPTTEQPVQESDIQMVDGNPVYDNVTPERAAQHLYDEMELDEEDADAWLDNNIARAKKRVEKANNAKPKDTSNLTKLKEQRQQINAEKEAAQTELDKWNAIKGARIQQKNAATEVNNYTPDSLIEMSKNNAVKAREIELSPENWAAEFGEDGIVSTPLGNVKMGDNQYLKMAQQGRNGKLGMIKPTLEDPDFVIADEGKSPESAERKASYIYVRSFIGEDGKRMYHFTSVTVSQNGQEVSVSNQEKSAGRIKNLLKGGKVIYVKKESNQSASETQMGESVLVGDSQAATNADNNTAPLGVNSPDNLSDSKGTTNNSTDQINSEENLQQPTTEPAPTAADLAAETTAPSAPNVQTTTSESPQVTAETSTPSAPNMQTTDVENAPNNDKVFSLKDAPNPKGIGRAQRTLVYEDGLAAFRAASMKIPAFQLGVENPAEMSYDKFAEEYKNRVGESRFKKDEPFLQDFYDYFTSVLNKENEIRRLLRDKKQGEENIRNANETLASNDPMDVANHEWAKGMKKLSEQKLKEIDARLKELGVDATAEQQDKNEGTSENNADIIREESKNPWKEPVASKPKKANLSRNRRKASDSFVTIGGKNYELTKADSDMLSLFSEDYDSFESLLNAFNNGEVLISPELAGVIKLAAEKGEDIKDYGKQQKGKKDATTNRNNSGNAQPQTEPLTDETRQEIVNTVLDEEGLNNLNVDSDIREDEPVSFEDEVAMNMRRYGGIDPDSFARETGLGKTEQRMANVPGMWKKGGMTIEEVAGRVYEELEFYKEGHSDQDVRNVIIEILSTGNAASYHRKQLENARRFATEMAEAERDAYVRDKYGFDSYDEYVAYLENKLAEDINNSKNLSDEDKMSIFGDEYESNNKGNENRRNANTREGSADTSDNDSNGVLQEVQTDRPAGNGEASRSEAERVPGSRNDVRSNDGENTENVPANSGEREARRERLRVDTARRLDEGISAKRRELETARKDLSDAQRTIQEEYGKDNDLFGNGRSTDGTLFETPRDYSAENIDAILTPKREKVARLEAELKTLEDGKQDAIDKALAAFDAQGEMFESNNPKLSVNNENNQGKEVSIGGLFGGQNLREGTRSVLDSLAKGVGARITILDTAGIANDLRSLGYTEADAQRAGYASVDEMAQYVEGYSSPNGGVVINSDKYKADKNTDGAIFFVISHELTHWLKTSNDPKVWNLFVDFVKESMGDSEWADSMAKAHRLYDGKKGYKEESDFEEEVCAKWAEDKLFTNRETAQKFIDKVENEGRNSVNIVRYILNFFNKVLDSLRKLGKDSLYRKIAATESAQKLWEEMYRYAKAHHAEILARNGIKFSLADKEEQYKVIAENNPKDESLGNHTWIEKPEDIMTFDEAMEDFGGTPDWTEADMQKARESGRVTVYSSHPIADGVFVTPSRMEAQNYAGEGKVYSKKVNIGNVAWIDSMQGQYAPLSNVAAKQTYGTTSDWKETGYLMADGSKLDFSGKKNGGESGRRTIDHRNIGQVYDETLNNRWDGVMRFLGEGNIRVMPESGMLSMMVKPTKEQMSAIKDFTRRNDGDVTLEFYDNNGYSDAYAEYESAKPSLVEADINRYFDEGIRPEGNIRFSIEEKPSDDELKAKYEGVSTDKLFNNIINEKGEIDNGSVSETVRRILSGETTYRRLGSKEQRGKTSVFQLAATVIAGRISKEFPREIRGKGKAEQNKLRLEYNHKIGKAILEYAKANGFVVEHINPSHAKGELGPDLLVINGTQLTYDYPFGGGAESQVFKAVDNESVIKQTLLNNLDRETNTVADTLEHLAVWNTRFPESAYNVIGITGNGHNIITRQRYIDGKTIEDYVRDQMPDASLAEQRDKSLEMVDAFMHDTYNMHRRGDLYSDGLVVVKDVADNFSNVMIDKNGKMFLVDGFADYDPYDVLGATLRNRYEFEDEEQPLVSDNTNLDNPDAATDVQVRFSIVEDPAKIDELENGETIKVYRAMQEIDGKLYPPMAAMTDGKLVQPIELGKWEQADERPELKVKDGKFRLYKGNGKYVDAAYNPYFHTSPTPLNDQFSEAQARPNLVTVEVEVPKSELTSGYKAEGAKDSVGAIEWKAGIIQGQLTGKRSVVLSRWDKPVRIVPDSEVADVIVGMFGDRQITMPSNVVTPSLRAELEKRGVPFVETDNKGILTEGENAGKYYSKVYGKKQPKTMRDIVDEVEEEKKAPKFSITSTPNLWKELKSRGVRYMPKVSSSEMATIQHWADTYATDIKKGEELGVYSANNYYLCTSNGYGNRLTVNFAIPVESNSDLINYLTEGDNGKIHRNPRPITGFDAFAQSVNGSNVPDDAVSSGGRNVLPQDDKVARPTTDSEREGTTENSISKDGGDNGRASRRTANPVKPKTTADVIREVEEERIREKVENPTPTMGSIVREVEEESTPKFSIVGGPTPSGMTAAEYYNKFTAPWVHQVDVAWRDNVKGLKIMQDAIAQETGKDIPEWADPYKAAIIKSSIDSHELDMLQRKYIQPLDNVIGELTKTAKVSKADVEDYLIAKHGLERNLVFADRDAKAVAQRRYTALVKMFPGTKKTLQDLYNEELLKNLDKDYSGLTGLTGKDNVRDAETEAKKMVNDFESKVGAAGVKELWDKIDAANTYALEKAVETGLMSQDQMDSLQKMFNNYVPLMDFDQTIAEDLWNYEAYSRRNGATIVPVVHKAKGRKSKAGNILGNIFRKASSVIVQGNKNKVKQQLYNLANSNPTDLLSTSKVWYVKDINGVWVEQQPDFSRLPADATPEQAKALVDNFNAQMEQLAKTGDAIAKKKGLNVPYKTLGDQSDAHAVKVMIDGQEYKVWVNGNPEAAQAINGKLDETSPLHKSALKKLNNFAAKGYTSLNPDFVMSNLQRDIVNASTLASINHGNDYALKMNGHIAENLPWLAWTHGNRGVAGKTLGIYALYHRYYNGTLDMSVPRERMFKEWIEGGGETGYATSLTAKQYEDMVDEWVKKYNKEIDVKGMLEAVGGMVEYVNRGIENAVRFAAYQTSRESGKGVQASVYDGKEISTNFNRHGSGAMYNATARAMYIFLNPGIQGTMQFLEASAQGHGSFGKVVGAEATHLLRRGVTAFAIISAAGMINAICNTILCGGDDGDDEGPLDSDNLYENMNAFKRRNNVCIYAGGNKFVTLPLSPEQRVPYGIGEIIGEHLMGFNQTPGNNLPLDIVGQTGAILPIDLYDENFASKGNSDYMEDLGLGVVKGVLPTSLSFVLDPFLWNEDFMGRPITGANEYNKEKPEYLRTKDNTPEWAKQPARFMNNITGGSDERRSEWGWGVLNPDALLYVLAQTFGGRATFFEKTYKSIDGYIKDFAEDAADEALDENGNKISNVKTRDIPIVNRFLYSVDNYYGASSRVNSAYKFYKGETKRSEAEFNTINHNIEEGKYPGEETQKRLQEFLATPEGKRWWWYTQSSGSKTSKKYMTLPNVKSSVKSDFGKLEERYYDSLNDDKMSRAEKQQIAEEYHYYKKAIVEKLMEFDEPDASIPAVVFPAQ